MVDEKTSTTLNRRQVVGGALAGAAAAALPLSRSTRSRVRAQAETTIEYWHPPHSADPEAEEQFLRGLIGQFEQQNAGIKVNLTILPWADAYQKWTTAIAAGAPPDVSISGSEAAIQFAAEGHLMPVTDLVNVTDPSDPNYFGMLPYFRYQEEYWQVPYIAGAWVFYYNPDMLATAGHQGSPTTWEQVKQIAQATTKDGTFGFPLSFSKNYTCNQAYMCMQSAWGAGALTPEGQVAMTSPGMVELTTFYASFFTEQLTPPDALSWTGSNELLAYFNSGRAPMAAAYGSQAGTTIEAAKQNGVNVAIANMPLGPGERPGSYGATNGHMIFAKAKNPEAARLFIQFLHQDENLVPWSLMTGWLPPTRTAAESPELDTPGFKAMRDQLTAGAVVRNGYAYGGHPANGVVEGQLVFADMLQQIVVAGKSVEDALAEYQTKLEEMYA
jgi:multiple sugar transport system substrate-binding protein